MDVGTPSVVGLVRLRATTSPDSTAVSDATESVSYGELWRRTESMARMLRTADVPPGRPIGLCLSPTVSRVAAILGVMGVGSPYVPIDPSHPDVRIRSMMESAGTDVLLVDERSAPRFASAPYRLIHLSAVEGRPESAEPAVTEPSSSDLAYVMYTSGSTGDPKGVAVEHGSVSHLLDALDTVLPRRDDGSDQCWLAAANICFDMSVADLFWPLTRGIPIVVAEMESLAGRSDEGAEFLTGVLSSGRITHFEATPSLVALMVQDPALAAAVRGLDVLVMGGEVVQPGLVAALRPIPHVINGYGPTETTVYTTMHECTDADVGHVPIGRPLPGVDLRVVDADGRDCPPDTPGELLIGGPGLARGYLNDAELTARKFPVLDGPGGPRRWYRTGDTVSMAADSTVTYRGRIDDQVKVRGFRVELGEIERAIRSVAGVDEAAVFPIRGEGSRVTGLTAAVRPAATGPVTEADIVDRISAVLPWYAVPHTIRIMPDVPIGRTGKLDRKAVEARLARLAAAAPGGAGTRPPSGSAGNGHERVVADVWGSVLGLRSAIDTDTNFFELGGDSALLGSVFGRLRQEFPDAELRLVDMYRHTTIAAMAARLGTGPVPPSGTDDGGRTGQVTDNPIRPSSAAERRRLARQGR